GRPGTPPPPSKTRRSESRPCPRVQGQEATEFSCERSRSQAGQFDCSSQPAAQGRKLYHPVPPLRQKYPCRRSSRTLALFQRKETRCRRCTTKWPGRYLHTE